MIQCELVPQIHGFSMAQMTFELSIKQLQTNAQFILDRASALGATAAQVSISESIETDIDVLNNSIENFENSYDTSLEISIYLGYNKVHIGTSQINLDNLDPLLTRAIQSAKFVEADPHNGIAEPELLCRSYTDNLCLYNPTDISNADLVAKVKNIESLALQADTRISSSNGAALSLGKYNFVLANTNGFNLGYQTTRFDTSISLIGNNKTGMQTDYWYDSSRDFNDLIADEELATMAAYRTTRRLNMGKIKAGSYPVIFEYPIAKALIGNFLGAINGNNLYRKLSFLNDSINTQIFPSWVNIDEDPFILKGLASCYFDNEGVRVGKHPLVDNGIVRNYQLNCYTARKLQMQSTGNSGGNHNILVNSNFNGDIHALAKIMSKGLIVTETIGHGLNMVTGDYSFGASGLWVEGGEIKFFVDNITLAGNLKQTFQNILQIANDCKRGGIICGSMLIDNVTISV